MPLTRVNTGFWLLVCVCLNLFLAVYSASAEWTAEVLPSQNPKETISAITWLDSSVPIETVPKGTDFESQVNVKFRFNKTDWTLIFNDKRIFPSDAKSKEYALNIRLLGEVTPVKIVAVGLLGEVEMQQILIRVPSWVEFQKKRFEDLSKKSYFFTSLGFSSVSFQETGLVDFSMLAPTLKGSFNYLLSPSWEFGINAFINLFSLKKSGIENSVRFLGANVRFGYAFPFVRSPDRLSLLVGAYYSTMLGANNQFGYKTMLYPHLYPTYRRKMRNGDSYFAYLKYVPLSPGFGINFRERELAVGAGWEHPLAGGHPIVVGVDISNMRLFTSDSHQMSMQTLSVSVGYGW